MSLFYECGKGMVKTSFARADIGADVYMVCPGPSMEIVDRVNLHVPGVITFGINTSFPRFKPDIWIGMDRPACYDPSLLNQPFPKIFRGSYSSEMAGGKMLKDYPQSYFASVDPTICPFQMFQHRQHETLFCWDNNTFTTALHLMIWMGAKRIHLVGCDFGGGKDYHDDRVLSDTQKDHNKRLHAKLLAWLPILRLEAKQRGIELISCTEISNINLFLPYIPLEDAIAASEKKPSSFVPEPMHAIDAEMCRWKRTPRNGMGVMVGCDREQEWLLPWWWANYDQFNDLPVAFVSMGGMSEDAKKFCREAGELIELGHGFTPAWLGKPLAILNTPFRNTLWMDLDCEVRGRIDGIVDPGSIYGNFDPVFPSEINTGVLLIPHGHSIVVEWMRMILGNPAIDRDQDAFNMLDLAGVNTHFKMQSMRLGTDDPKTPIFHWTGPEGKEIIRKKMASK